MAVVFLLLWVDLEAVDEREAADEPEELVRLLPEEAVFDFVVVVFLRVSANGTTLSKRAEKRPRNSIILQNISYSKICSISREKKLGRFLQTIAAVARIWYPYWQIFDL